MKSPILFLVLIAIYFENVCKAEITQMRPLIVLKKATGHSKHPINPSASKCGGTAQLIEARWQNCKVKDNMCIVPALEQFQAEIDFIPDKDAKGLSFKIIIEVEDEDPVIIHNEPILNSIVHKDVKYTIEILTVIDDSLKGKKTKGKFVVTDRRDGSLKLCMETEAMIG